MTNELSLTNKALVVSTKNIESYISSTYQIPVLDREAEHDLAVAYQNNEDFDAARKLVMHSLRFVIQVARGYNGYGLPLADLIQEGNVGLMKAVKRFDPDREIRLISFAVHWVRAEIHEYILRNWRQVKVATTKAQRKLFFNLRSAKKRLAWLNQAEINTIAKDLGVKPEEVVEMESRLSGQDIGFDIKDDANEDSYIAPASWLTCENSDPATLIEDSDWSKHNENKLYKALENIDERSVDILRSRWLGDKKTTLQALADKYSVSAERIRQLEKNAMTKLQASLA